MLTFLAPMTLAKGLPQKLPEKRGPASFTQGFRILNKDCAFYEGPKKSSKSLFEVEAGRRIWFTAVDSQWLFAKTKKEAKEVYLPATCVK